MAAVGRTFWYTLVMTLLVTALAALLAVLLNQKLKLQGFWRVTYFLPRGDVLHHHRPDLQSDLLPRGASWSGKALGIALLSKNPLSNRNLAMWAIMLIQVWKETAVPTVLILAGAAVDLRRPVRSGHHRRRDRACRRSGALRCRW